MAYEAFRYEDEILIASLLTAKLWAWCVFISCFLVHVVTKVHEKLIYAEPWCCNYLNCFRCSTQEKILFEPFFFPEFHDVNFCDDFRLSILPSSGSFESEMNYVKEKRLRSCCYLW